MNKKKEDGTSLQKPLDTVAMNSIPTTTTVEKKPEPKNDIKMSEGPRKFIGKKKEDKEQIAEKVVEKKEPEPEPKNDIKMSEGPRKFFGEKVVAQEKKEPENDIKMSEGPRKFIGKKKEDKEQNQEKSQTDVLIYFNNF
jgi:hypothetical protein